MKKIVIVIVCAAVLIVAAIGITYAIVYSPAPAVAEKGDKGDKGERGTDGKDGFLTAYEMWLENGNQGTHEDFIASFKGRDGTDGQNGTDGIDGRDGADGLNGKNGGESLYLHIYKVRLESYNLSYYNTDFLDFYLHLTFGFDKPFSDFNSLRSFMGNSVLPFSGFGYLNGGYYDGLALFNIQTGTVYNPNMAAFPFDLTNIVSEEFSYHIVNMGVQK